MSKNDSGLFSDVAKLANSALATTANMKNEMVKLIKEQITTFVKSMDFIEREEFEVVKKMAMQNAVALEKLTGKKHSKDQCIDTTECKTHSDRKSKKKSTTNEEDGQ